jgi:hypothetical protein
MLQKAGLAELIDLEIGEVSFAVTREENAVPRALGALNDRW